MIAQSLIALESRGIRIEWLPSTSEDVVGYHVYISSDGGSTYIKANLIIITDYYFNTLELKIGHEYFFKVRSVDLLGNFFDSEPTSIFLT
jgi:hypothetical protein